MIKNTGQKKISETMVTKSDQIQEKLEAINISSINENNFCD